MKILKFKNTLHSFLKDSCMSEIEAIEQIASDNNISVVAIISSEDLGIYKYDNISKVYKLIDGYLITGDSSEIDQFCFVKDVNVAERIAAEFCRNEDEGDLDDENYDEIFGF